MDDPHLLERYVTAQDGIYEAALAEIRRGAKRTHWMWFVFPQFAGLGASEMSQRYAIRSLEEARAYLLHPVLGPRLRECVSGLQNLTDRSATQVFGSVDAAKLRSSLTLFEQASDEPLFAAAIDRWFGGTRDDATLALLNGSG